MRSLTVRGRVDAQGQLISADAPLLRLQQLAGADLGQAIAMPRLAQMVFAAMDKKQSLLRAVVMGDYDAIIQGIAKISPHGDGADIVIHDWAVTKVERRPNDVSPDTIPSPMGWSWETDADLNLVALRLGASAPLVTADWPGRPLFDVLQLNADANGQMPIINAQRTGQMFIGQSVTTADRAIVRHDMVLNGTPLFNGLGRLSGFRGVAEPAPHMDIAQCPHFQRDGDDRFELRFNQRVDEALRQPIGQIIRTAESIAGEVDGAIRADYARYAGDIAQAGRHLLGLVDDLADVQSIESPHFTIVTDVLDLSDLSRRAAALIAVQAEAKNISLHVPQASPDYLGMGEHRRVLQILLNLLTNAVRYSAKDTHIMLSLDRVGEQICVTISDQGPGISPDQQLLIFEKFERLGRHDGGGSGLGLYIARKLARAMGGDLSVTSQVGHGSRFSLSLMAAPRP